MMSKVGLCPCRCHRSRCILATTCLTNRARFLTAAATAPRNEPERVKVFLRVRPPKPEGETPGALRIKPDGKGVVVYRE